jgi:hypothetical protein
MRISETDMAGLLAPASASVPAPQRPQQRRCGREVARANEYKCVKAVAHFGHLRVAELARCVWPTARYGEQLARRTLRRLTDAGLLLERRNALGSKSMCLTRGGASWLELRGVPAQHTLELTSVSGATFFHRTMATRYLIERQTSGSQVAGEYLILRRDLPFSIDRLVKTMQKFPDGLVWHRNKLDSSISVELIEQEAARKSRTELEKCLRASEFVGGSISADGSVKLAGLVFVYDRALSHARRILLAANSLWGNRTAAERATLERRVKLVAVELRDPLVWVSSSAITLHDYRLKEGA